MFPTDTDSWIHGGGFEGNATLRPTQIIFGYPFLRLKLYALFCHWDSF